MSRSSQNKNLVCPVCDEVHPIVEKDPKDHLRINIRVGETLNRINNIEIEEIVSKKTGEALIKLFYEEVDKANAKYGIK